MSDSFRELRHAALCPESTTELGQECLLSRTLACLDFLVCFKACVLFTTHVALAFVVRMSLSNS